MIPYRHSNIKRARKLRKEATPWEQKLWYEFLRDYPVKFRRQAALDNYIADFYCFKAKLIIELDGSQHFEKGNNKKDDYRTERLEKHGLMVLHIPNNDVDENFYGVCEYIDGLVKSRVE